MARLKKARQSKKSSSSFNWQLYVTLSIIVLLVLPVTLLGMSKEQNVVSHASTGTNTPASVTIANLQAFATFPDQPAAVSYSLNTTGALSVSDLVVAVRDANGQNFDYPARSNITLQGEQTFVSSRTFPAGTYTFWVGYNTNGTWVDLTPKQTFTIN